MTLRRSDINDAILAQSPDREATLKRLPWVGKYRKPSNKKRENPEQLFQIACVEYLKLYPDILFFSVPNHLWAGKTTNEGAMLNYMARQRSMGLKRGVSDLILAFRNSDGMAVTCAAECKAQYGKLSEDQQLFADKANSVGWFTATIYTLEDLRNLLKQAKHPRHV